ncbi:MAG: cytochrome c class [Myxococcaceae bacterium]|nr:cytochrome c class [Myxococcaceae bacterium]
MRLSILPVCLLVASVCFAEVPEKKVARLWKAKCSACHGVDGRGQTETGLKLKLPDFTTAAWQQKTTDEFIRNRVTRGISETRDGVLKEMPAFGAELKPEHLDAIVAMLRKLGGGNPEAALTPTGN